MRKTILWALIAAVTTAPAVPSLAGSPETLAARTAVLARKGDWDAYARLMHPEALSDLKRIFRPIAAADESGQVLRRLFDVDGIEQYDRMTDREAFKSLMSNLVRTMPAFAEAMQTSDVSVIGQVPEGSDLVHVVYRFGARAEGITVSKTGVITFRRHEGEWRALLSGNIEGLAARLRQLSAPKQAPK